MSLFPSDTLTSVSKVTVESLKAENDQLKTGGPSSRPTSSSSQSSGLMSLGTSSPRQSMAASLPKTLSMNIGESGGAGKVPQTHTHTHKHAHAHTHTYSHAHSHAHMHTYTHTHTHTQTHT